MPKRIAPSAVKAQELAALSQGHTAVERGAAWLRPCGQLATERELHDALDREQPALRGRHRAERCGTSVGDRHGYAEGIFTPRERLSTDSACQSSAADDRSGCG